MHLTDVLTIILTAAIAGAGIAQAVLAKRQAVTADNLLSLQQAIEKQRNTAWLFPRITEQTSATTRTAILEISNLSEVGVWIEKITVNIKVPSASLNKAQAVLVQEPLESMDKFRRDILNEILLLAAPKRGKEYDQITLWCDVEYWAKGSFRSESTNHYSVEVNQWSIHNVQQAG